LEEENLREGMLALMQTLSFVNLASEEVIGKAAPTLMYITGKDLGKEEGDRLDVTEDVEEALVSIYGPPGDVWHVELWKHAEEEEYVFGEGLEMKMRLLYQACPVREACLAAGIRMGGVVCQITHGLAAGALERIFERKVDIRTEHMGPGACMLVLETTLD
jgi:predicted hydrocarbon binding protein